MDADLTHLLHRRQLDIPQAHEHELTAYWEKISSLRDQVEESQLADNEIALTWTAVSQNVH